MNDCSRADVRDLLPDLLNDRLDPRTRAEVERHVASCAACAQEMALLSDLRPLLARAPAVNVARIANAVQESRTPKASGRPRIAGRSWMQLAAGIALVLGGATGVLLWSRAQTATAPGTPVAVAPTPATESPSVAPADRPADTPDTVRAPVPNQAPGVASNNGIVFGGGVGDLADADLEALLGDLERLDALTDVEPEPLLPDIGEGL